MAIREDSSHKLTYEDYLGFPDDGQRHEILEGVHTVTPSSSSDHQAIQIRLGTRLFLAIEETGLGRVFNAPMDVRLSDHDIVQPDLLAIRREREAIIQAIIQGPPDLIVEVLSRGTSRRDREFKREIYARHGVREYWIVDPEARQVLQLVRRLPSDSEFEEVGAPCEAITSHAFEGVAIDLTRIW